MARIVSRTERPAPVVVVGHKAGKQAVFYQLGVETANQQGNQMDTEKKPTGKTVVVETTHRVNGIDTGDLSAEQLLNASAVMRREIRTWKKLAKTADVELRQAIKGRIARRQSDIDLLLKLAAAK